MNKADYGDQIVLPQWLSSQRAARTREAEVFASIPPDANYGPSIEAFRELLAEFKTEPSPFAGSELMGVAVVLGLKDESRELAEYVTAEAVTGRVAQAQAKLILGGESSPVVVDERRSIKRAKRRLFDFPRDAFAWLDQARLYTILGQQEKARRAVLAALHLAPTDRLVVRSGIRFFAHHGEWDAALYHADKAYRSNRDPFILGPLLSVGTQLDKLPVRLKPTADRALSAPDRFLYSEVLAAIGTYEILNGANKRSRRFFKRAWTDPAKAVVSQSQWVLREHLPNLASEQNIDFSQSAEAMSWLRFAILDFKGAVSRAHEWVLEEPYSRSAHVHGSNSACIIDDYKTAQEVAERGLRANPGDQTLINNLAFAQLRRGRVSEAARTFEPLCSALNDPKEVTVLATYGLLRMAQGNVEDGRRFYEESIRRASDAGDRRTALRATLHFLISGIDLSRSVDTNALKQSTVALKDSVDASCVGLAMTVARRLKTAQLDEGGDLRKAAAEFTSVMAESRVKLLSSIFAESLQQATQAPASKKDTEVELER